MAPHAALARRDKVDGNNGSVFASFIIFLSVFIVFLSYGVWRRRQLARRQDALLLQWGLAGIDGLDNNAWPWWGRTSRKIELQPPQLIEVWIKPSSTTAEPEWTDFTPLSATLVRQPALSTEKHESREQPTPPVIPPDNRPRMRQWLSFSTRRPMPDLPPPPPPPAEPILDPVRDVQVGVLLSMPSPSRNAQNEVQEPEVLVMGFTSAPWETTAAEAEQKAPAS